MLATMHRVLARTFFFCALCVVVATSSAVPSFPTLSGRVVDNASLLNAQTKQSITAQLAKHENDTSNQVVVVTVNSLQEYPIEEYANLLFRHWKIGQSGKDNGVVFLVAKSDRKVRIEVGYGLEGILTDAVSKQIIENEILPQFRSGNFEGGISAGTDSIIQTLSGNYVPSEKAKPIAKASAQCFSYSSELS